MKTQTKTAKGARSAAASLEQRKLERELQAMIRGVRRKNAEARKRAGKPPVKRRRVRVDLMAQLKKAYGDSNVGDRMWEKYGALVS